MITKLKLILDKSLLHKLIKQTNKTSTMSPLPYQTDTTDTTEKISLVNPSTTVPSSMWKKAGVAMTLGAVFVVGNSYGSNNSAMIRPTDFAAASVSQITFGDLNGKDFVPTCDKTPALFKPACECSINKCGELVDGFINTSSAARNCIRDKCATGSLSCLMTCIGEDPGDAGKKFFDCINSSGCSNLIYSF
mmetsp:Transcript_37983/g.41163  ORF Transcript_37983/g.41163 Transcript_37983/m.41163 type:complete len:191 (-) Transcript_37983:68-640(-)